MTRSKSSGESLIGSGGIRSSVNRAKLVRSYALTALFRGHSLEAEIVSYEVLKPVFQLDHLQNKKIRGTHRAPRKERIYRRPKWA